MPRGPRLDAPATLHHVMVRGLERRASFQDTRDRNDFLDRLATLASADAIAVYTWALLPNHAHLLLRTGTRPLARPMRSLLTGYAGAFNRRRRRVGHRFQNRDKSILVEAAPYPPLVAECARAWGVSAEEVRGSNRRRPAAHMRAAVSALAVRHLGLSAAAVARTLGVTPAVVLRGVDRGPHLLETRGLDPGLLLRRVRRNAQ